MEGAGAHLHVVGLQDDAAALGPEALQGKDEALERARGLKMSRLARHVRSMLNGMKPQP
jgi:hypothetical protein